MDKEESGIFYEMFDRLPRKGPGSFESTRKAYETIGNQLNKPGILDVGCGSGRQTLDLLSISDGNIIAVDNYLPYINELNEKLNRYDLTSRASAIREDMFNLNFNDASFNLIWSEGAIYIIGFEKGLLEFKRLLKPGGFIAVTEISWLVNNPSRDSFEFWIKNYPGINTIEKNLLIIEQCGYRFIDSFVLPEKDWLDNYYSHLQININRMREKYSGYKKALDIINAEQYEIDLYKRFSNDYGYVFYIMQKIN